MKFESPTSRRALCERLTCSAKRMFYDCSIKADIDVFSPVSPPALRTIWFCKRGTDLTALTGKSSWSQLESVITTLAEDKTAQNQAILKLWLNGELFYEKKTKTLVTAEKVDKRYNIQHALTGEALGEVKKRALKKVKINNQLRSTIRTALAAWDLESKDATTRLAAVKESTRSLNEATYNHLMALHGTEKNDDVREAMETAMALFEFRDGSNELKAPALSLLSESDDSFIRSELEKAKKSAAFTELKSDIDDALKSIDSRQKYYSAAENIFFGLSLGSVLLLAAIGLAITFGVMGVINMAHGEMMMLGAYTTFVIQSAFPSLLEQSLFIAIPAAFLIAGAVGVLIEKLVIQHLRQTFGNPVGYLCISLILQQAVRTVFSPLNQAVSTPE